MGKLEQQLPLQQHQVGGRRSDGSSMFCERCSMGLSRIGRQFSFKCVVILILSVSVFVSAIFWVFPRHSRQLGFDAKDEIKRSAPVQAYFRLPKPVSLLVPHIPRLEYDINGEIGVPYTKVAILSMHEAGASNWTYVVFGVLSDPMNVPINAVSLSVLRSSLIELFLQESNLTLSTSSFGQPSSFEILMFPGGITIIPEQYASIWQIPQIFFNFTLYNSIYEIEENFVELKEQLKLGLHLKPYENVYVQVTNRNGSTRDPPVTVQASVMSDLGIILPQRLKQLALTITESRAKNLGLDNSVFGKVNEISLSSYLNRTLRATPPTPSPAPSPEQNDYADPSISPSYAPAPSPDFHQLPPCINCDAASPTLPPILNSPAPSVLGNRSPHPSPHCGAKISPSLSPSSHSDAPSPALSPHASNPFPPSMGPTSQVSPGLSPLPVVSYGSHPSPDKGNGKVLDSPPLASPSILSLSSSSIAGPSYKQIWWWFCFFMLATHHLLCWS